MSHRILAIGREYGSGGRKIGLETAQTLGIGFYDTELITMAAERGKMDVETLKETDEKKANPLWCPIPTYLSTEPTDYYVPLNDKLFAIQSRIIRELAQKEDCVIVGRCADKILEKEDIVSAFIYAAFDDRVKTIMERAGLSEKDAASRVRQIDKRRKLYYNYYSDKQWGEKKSYDLMLNSSALGAELCVKILREAFLKGSI